MEEFIGSPEEAKKWLEAKRKSGPGVIGQATRDGGMFAEVDGKGNIGPWRSTAARIKRLFGWADNSDTR